MVIEKEEVFPHVDVVCYRGNTKYARNVIQGRRKDRFTGRFEYKFSEKKDSVDGIWGWVSTRSLIRRLDEAGDDAVYCAYVDAIGEYDNKYISPYVFDCEIIGQSQGETGHRNPIVHFAGYDTAFDVDRYSIEVLLRASWASPESRENFPEQWRAVAYSQDYIGMEEEPADAKIYSDSEESSFASEDDPDDYEDEEGDEYDNHEPPRLLVSSYDEGYEGYDRRGMEIDSSESSTSGSEEAEENEEAEEQEQEDMEEDDIRRDSAYMTRVRKVARLLSDRGRQMEFKELEKLGRDIKRVVELMETMVQPGEEFDILLVADTMCKLYIEKILYDQKRRESVMKKKKKKPLLRKLRKPSSIGEDCLCSEKKTRGKHQWHDRSDIGPGLRTRKVRRDNYNDKKKKDTRSKDDFNDRGVQHALELSSRWGIPMSELVVLLLDGVELGTTSRLRDAGVLLYNIHVVSWSVEIDDPNHLLGSTACMALSRFLATTTLKTIHLGLFDYCAAYTESVRHGIQVGFGRNIFDQRSVLSLTFAHRAGAVASKYYYQNALDSWMAITKIAYDNGYVAVTSGPPLRKVNVYSWFFRMFKRTRIEKSHRQDHTQRIASTRSAQEDLDWGFKTIPLPTLGKQQKQKAPTKRKNKKKTAPKRKKGTSKGEKKKRKTPDWGKQLEITSKAGGTGTRQRKSRRLLDKDDDDYDNTTDKEGFHLVGYHSEPHWVFNFPRGDLEAFEDVKRKEVKTKGRRVHPIPMQFNYPPDSEYAGATCMVQELLRDDKGNAVVLFPKEEGVTGGHEGNTGGNMILVSTERLQHV